MNVQEPKLVGKVTFGRWNCDVWLGCYITHPNVPALYLSEEGNERYTVAIASTNLSGQTGLALQPGCVWLKGWNENYGLPALLELAGFVGPVLSRIPTGHVEATMHKLLMG